MLYYLWVKIYCPPFLEFNYEDIISKSSVSIKPSSSLLLKGKKRIGSSSFRFMIVTVTLFCTPLDKEDVKNFYPFAKKFPPNNGRGGGGGVKSIILGLFSAEESRVGDKTFFY